MRARPPAGPRRLDGYGVDRRRDPGRAAHASGHDVHQDQPALVAEAIRQVVAGVRDPDAWSDLTACCAAAPEGAAAQQAP